RPPRRRGVRGRGRGRGR
ncbi:hypothetical protein CFC21_105541, partial [Triticum aestivum]